MKESLWNGKEVLSVIKGHGSDNWNASGVSIDSRTLNPGDIFFALYGKNYDGHDFIPEALDRGAEVVISNAPSKFSYEKIIFVDDVLMALTNLGIYARNRTKAMVIAVTGSSGKTTLKEMIAFGLSEYGKVYSSHSSYNNHIGVPLSLTRIPLDTQYVIIEIGMNRMGEISNLSNITKPNIAVINNVGTAHFEFFKSIEEIKKEKASITDGLLNQGHLIYNYDLINSPSFNFESLNKEIDFLTFGKNKEADFSLSNYEFNNDKCRINAKYKDQNMNFYLPFIGKHMALNCLAAALVCISLGNNPKNFLKKMGSFELIEGRGKRYICEYYGKRITIIDESYNSNPDSMSAAIQTFSSINNLDFKRKVLIVGDMLELGILTQKAHENLASEINNTSIDCVLACGKEIKYTWEKIIEEKKGSYYSETDSLIEDLRELIRDGDLLLLKGSSSSNVHKIAKKLLSHFPVRKIA
tara:strand:- start:7163 stop:8566 length:1404 start_codon:yes stop_codon:yes gene_type:complete